MFGHKLAPVSLKEFSTGNNENSKDLYKDLASHLND